MAGRAAGSKGAAQTFSPPAPLAPPLVAAPGIAVSTRQACAFSRRDAPRPLSGFWRIGTSLRQGPASPAPKVESPPMPLKSSRPICAILAALLLSAPILAI
jgi:hypothetical protein